MLLADVRESFGTEPKQFVATLDRVLPCVLTVWLIVHSAEMQRVWPDHFGEAGGSADGLS